MGYDYGYNIVYGVPLNSSHIRKINPALLDDDHSCGTDILDIISDINQARGADIIDIKEATYIKNIQLKSYKVDGVNNNNPEYYLIAHEEELYPDSHVPISELNMCKNNDRGLKEIINKLGLELEDEIDFYFTLTGG